MSAVSNEWLLLVWLLMKQRNLQKFTKQAHAMGYTPEKIVRASSSLILWGGAAAAGVLLYAQGVRKVRTDVLESIPFVKDYFRSTHEVPASDNPF
ncbi:protein of unknown function [Taphrina deformans PYCC 5710]|uniref:Cytochrome b-c1 complex subunit 10 n=1 Tax=Taphrina deformans (strain PYCC 5710 / ATCC 11124 / CBS 356.35 / IMI 108563 / JCM 9778 / NBRC 8474) TaxID=1097556 RepID=R4X7B1_TAPDE|nr:protein of unknown function [Taphrina deformans PYCC 5710]|eukprot:CCG81222.1 protein of unknown function [Taphrina deformans PYCC 5710]